MPHFSERFSVKGRAEKCKNEGIRVQNMSDLINGIDEGLNWNCLTSWRFNRGNSGM